MPPTTGAGGLPALVGAPDLFLDIGVCGHDAWAQEVAAGLTDGGFHCNAPPSGETARSAGHSNYRSTWVDTRTIAIELIQSLHDQKAMPDIRIGINPNPGVVSVQSWFWVLRSSYANAPIVASGSQSVPWEESWDETTSHEEDVSCDDGSPGPCHRTVTETHPVVVDHTDVITATDTFTPATYTWDFGDGQPGSQQSYPADRGLGLPYTNPTTPSSVAWRYQFDSRDHPDGYPITVIVTWGVGFHVRATSDVAAGNYDMAGAMKPRNERYATTHIVRQVQSLRVAEVQGVRSP